MHNQIKEARRFTGVDWLLIIFALVGILIGGVFLYKRYQAATPTVEAEYLLCVSGIESIGSASVKDWGAALPIGTPISSSNGTAELGRITAVEVRACTVATVKDGEVVFVGHPSRSDLFLTLQAEATVTDADGIRVRDIRVAAGEVWDIRVGGYYLIGAEILRVGLESAS